MKGDLEISNRDVLKILFYIRHLAEKMDYKAYVVGGFVRDLLLGVENLDMDVVVEGDGIEFAQNLASLLKGDLIRHRRFGTATIKFFLPRRLDEGSITKKNKFKIDISTARKEYYEYPAALPKVTFGSIKDDLYRRDFTINAMAMKLNKGGFSDLIDFFGGREDLESGNIRVLHNLSFIDDPTRILRAIRFEQRYNFRLEKTTYGLLKKAVSLGMLEYVDKQRIRDEIVLILKEVKPIRYIKRLSKLCGLSFIHPKLKITSSVLKSLSLVDKNITWFNLDFPKKRPLDTWLIYFIVLIDKLSIGELKRFCEKFAFCKGETSRIVSYKKMATQKIKKLKSPKLPASYIYRLLQPLSYEVILLILSKTKIKATHLYIKNFLKVYNNIRLLTSGEDLANLGARPGKGFKEMLNKTLYAKLDGKLKTKDEELSFLKKQLNRDILKSYSYRQ